jgi:acetoacetyl-CoA synthetase
VFDDYQSLWSWSTSDVRSFWRAVYDYFQVIGSGDPEIVLDRLEMPGARWFPQLKINFAENLLSKLAPDSTVVIAHSESRGREELTGRQLTGYVHAAAAALERLGISAGDRVVAYAPNTVETLISMLATVSIGAIWSSCSPDFGPRSVLDRFRQIEPTLLIFVRGYRWRGKDIDRAEAVGQLLGELPSLKVAVQVSLGGSALLADERVTEWDRFLRLGTEVTSPFAYQRFPFDHPLWILYSSGTSGPPKPIVHGHGGVVLEMRKVLALHKDIRPGDRLFMISTTGWMVYNVLVSALMSGASVVLFDGDPLHPDSRRIPQLLADESVTHFGCGVSFMQGLQEAGAVETLAGSFTDLRMIILTGSPATPEVMGWIPFAFGGQAMPASMSGGTDIVSAFVGGVPDAPVYAGEIQAPCLGVDAFAAGEDGEELVNEVGELVVRKPMPSMPLFFWGDPDFRRYRSSYFEWIPGLWRHGDYVLFNERRGCFIRGRSDSTLNRYGVRIGTAEVYRVVDAMPDVESSLVINLELPGGRFSMVLFVKLAAGVSLDQRLTQELCSALRASCSPRHVPDRVMQVPDIPTTLTGKKCEIPVKKVLSGEAPGTSMSPGALANPAAMDWFIAARARGEFAGN